MADKINTDEEFDGFEQVDDAFDDSADASDDLVDDAEFQDLSDSLDSDVFEDDAQPAAAPKKKTNWFNIIVAVVAIAGAGGLILNKLGPQLLGGGAAPVGLTNAQMGGPAAPATPAQSEAAAQAALAPTPGNIPAGGMLENPDAFAELAGNTQSPAVQAKEDAAIPDPFAGLNKPDANAVPMPAPITAEPAPAIPAPAAPADVAVAAQEAAMGIPAPALEAAPVMPAVPAAPVRAEPVASADNSALKSEVDTLADRMNSMETKLDAALAGMTQVQAASAPADDGRFAAIQKTLERLETRLDDISSNRTQRVSAPARADIIDDAPAAAPVKKKSLPKKASAPKKQETAWDEPYKGAKVVVVTPVAAGNTSGWELRGAQPGSAIIGQSGGDVRQVSIGDTVPGLGQVTGIAQMNGRWVVQGTQGRLAQ